MLTPIPLKQITQRSSFDSYHNQYSIAQPDVLIIAANPGGFNLKIEN